jgi:hypothetical protein
MAITLSLGVAELELRPRGLAEQSTCLVQGQAAHFFLSNLPRVCFPGYSRSKPWELRPEDQSQPGVLATLSLHVFP